MDRANPPSAEAPAPPPVPTASSAMSPTDTPGVTQNPVLSGLPGTQTTQPASEAPYDAGGQQSSDLQFQREVVSSHQPPPQSTAEHPPSRHGTNSDGAPPQLSQQPVETAATHEAMATSGTRPTTGSLGGLTTDPHQRSNPPTPPTARPALPQVRTTRSAMTTSMEKLGDSDTLSGLGLNELHRDSAVPTTKTLPPLPPVRLVDNGRPHRQRTLNGYGSALGHWPSTRRSGIDWIVPVEEKRRITVWERVEPTLKNAIAQRDKSARRARTLGWAMNGAIGVQVLLGSLTTGLSGVGVTGRQTAVTTTVLGALTTIIASYLAKVRGTSEPEFSRARVKHLDRFIREARSFLFDHGHIDTHEWDEKINQLRQEFEALLTKTKKEKKAKKSESAA